MKELLELIKKRASNPETIHDMAMGLSPKPKIGDIISLAEIEEAEKEMGFKLPDLLKSIYTQIGNGGFGPGYGLYNLSGSKKNYFDVLNSNAIKKGFFPICTWGCGIDSYIDCNDDSYPVYFKTEETDDDGNCSCMGNLSFTVTDKDGNVISSGENASLSEILGSMGSGNSKKKDSKPKGLRIHKKAVNEWFSDWVKGKNLWDQMMGEEETGGNVWK